MLKLVCVEMQDRMNYFNNLNGDYIKRINIPCEMTGIEIIEEINALI